MQEINDFCKKILKEIRKETGVILMRENINYDEAKKKAVKKVIKKIIDNF